MAYIIYSDESRENDPHALPDVEIFQLTRYEVAETDAYADDWREFSRRHEFRLAPMNSRVREQMVEAMVEELDIKGGWFYWSCFPGCLPDGPPMGPYPTRAEAEQAARDDYAE